MAQSRDPWTFRRARQAIAGTTAVMLVPCWILVAAMPLEAGRHAAQATQTTVTLSESDLNGHDAVGEEVVTRRSPTSDGEEVVIEVYRPSINGDRLVLSRRVRRVTTAAADWSRTVEETESRSPAFPEDPTMHVVRRSVTTVRRSGPDSYVRERQEFERDVNGRLAPIRKEVAHLGSR